MTADAMPSNRSVTVAAHFWAEPVGGKDADLRKREPTGGLEPPTPCLQVTICELRCVSKPFIHCYLSTGSGTVAVAQYRVMLGKREHSAPTDAPTCSRLIRSPELTTTIYPDAASGRPWRPSCARSVSVDALNDRSGDQIVGQIRHGIAELVLHCPRTRVAHAEIGLPLSRRPCCRRPDLRP